MSGPILLFGMPRSGTTWLGKIFDSHPDTLYRHEPDSFGRLNFLPPAPEPDQTDQFAERVRDFVDSLPAVRETKVSATLPSFRKSYLGPLQRGWNEAALRIAKGLAQVRGETAVALWLPAAAVARARPVWKSIESVARLGIISASLPQARSVLIVRHPCGYMASVLRGKSSGRFTDNESIGEDLGLLEPLTQTASAREYGLDLERLRRMSPVQRLAWHWALCNDKAMLDTEAANRTLVLRYEDLCEDPEGQTRRLFEWTGLEFGQQTRDFLSASTGTHRSRYYSVFKDPRRAASQWRRELPREVQDEIRDCVGHTRAGRLFFPDAGA